MTRMIDHVLDRITMYRLVLYYLAALLVLAFALGFANLLPVDPTALAFSTLLIGATCWATNWAFARVFQVAANIESVHITALILILIMAPVTAADHAGVGALVLASVWSIASKYILAIRAKHVFNPAAIGVALTAQFLDQPATWWVAGNPYLIAPVVIGGVLLTRKLRRADLVLSFALAAIATLAATTPPADYIAALSNTLIYSPALFMAFVMLTEPLTTPPRLNQRLINGALVGCLAMPTIHFGTLQLTPELALLIGNVFASAVSPKGRFKLTLEHIERAANGAYDFVFRSDRKLAFEAGQYLEWTLDVPYSDNRGNRRQFTVASAPTEDEVRLGVKFYPAPSTFKRALAAMKPGDTIFASQLAGDFVLPAKVETKLAFIAGGIGITPFRSQLQDLLDRRERRPIVVLYGNNTVAEIAYGELLDHARRELGIKTVYAVAREAEIVPGVRPGYIDAKLIRAEVPDFLERIFYVSGPQAMVAEVRRQLRGLGVARRRIKTDFFPGFA